MNRIDPVPRARCWNYREFSRLGKRVQPLINLAHVLLCFCQRESASRKKHGAKERKSSLAESLDALRWQLRDDGRRADIRESINTLFNPIHESIRLHAVQQIVPNIGYERGCRELNTLM